MQRKRKGNDRQAYQSHIKRQEAYERGWLDDADEEYPDYGEAEAYDTEKMAGLVRGQPVVSGYEALERRRGRRKPPTKCTIPHWHKKWKEPIPNTTPTGGYCTTAGNNRETLQCSAVSTTRVPCINPPGSYKKIIFSNYPVCPYPTICPAES